LLESSQVRNRIAHDQWKYAFTNNLKNFYGNYSLKYKKNLSSGTGYSADLIQ